MKDKKGKLFVISGPSGSGKSTINNILTNSESLAMSISATTRTPREHEIDGEHYHFLTKEEFEDKIKNDAFYEYAKVFNNYYGTLKEKVDKQLDAGNDVILEIDVQGAMQIKEINPEAVLIFIMPPSEEILYERLKNRNTESKAELELRTEIAKKEMQMKNKYDYIVVNDNLEDAVAKIFEIIKLSKA